MREICNHLSFMCASCLLFSLRLVAASSITFSIVPQFPALVLIVPLEKEMTSSWSAPLHPQSHHHQCLDTFRGYHTSWIHLYSPGFLRDSRLTCSEFTSTQPPSLPPTTPPPFLLKNTPLMHLLYVCISWHLIYTMYVTVLASYPSYLCCVWGIG